MKNRRRFTPEFKAQIVLEVLTGAHSPAEACRTHALSPNLLTTWKTTVRERAHTLFQGDEPRDQDQARIAELEQLLGRATRQNAWRQLGRLLEDGYNRKRIHSALGYLTPSEFEQQWVGTPRSQ